MKSKERHELKQNEFAVTAYGVADAIAANRTKVLAAVGILVVLLAIVGGAMMWNSHKANQAGAALGIAMATAQGQVVPASTLPGAVQQAGTFPTEQARAEAAIKAFNEVAASYPGTDAALAASYQAASELLAAGRPVEAETAFAAVAGQAGSGVYAPLARLGQAEATFAAGKTDEALRIYADLSAARDGALPVDGLLMQLGRISLKAGKTSEARAAFKRVVDEFPESGYIADAREQLAATN